MYYILGRVICMTLYVHCIPPYMLLSMYLVLSPSLLRSVYQSKGTYSQWRPQQSSLSLTRSTPPSTLQSVCTHHTHTYTHTHTRTHARTDTHTHTTHLYHVKCIRRPHFLAVSGCVTACIRESLCRDKV